MKHKLYLLLLFWNAALCAREPILIRDAENFYSTKTAIFLGKALVTGAIIANSPIDASIQNFYQDNIRNDETDKIAQVTKIFGCNMPLTIAFVSGITTSYLLKDTQYGKELYNYSMNTFRATITGFPLLVAGQVLLGCDRPSEYTNSYWHPFRNDHGVSGHTYMGAIPFTTAANMVKNPALKLLLIIASTATGFSRINDNSHYPSQVLLGWALAYASCSAITDSNITFTTGTDSITLGYTFWSNSSSYFSLAHFFIQQLVSGRRCLRTGKTTIPQKT